MKREIKYDSNKYGMGTLPFMAPEFLTLNTYFDHRIDTWALGVILHMMLTGKYPFYDKNMQLFVH